MKPKELRIGNYVNWINTKEQDALFLIEEIKQLNYHDCFQPIPLTEEWLLKFRFKETKEAKTIKWFNKGKLDIVLSDENFIVFDYLVLKHIKHVHQLQNLYFALTGEELQIKP